MYDHHLGPSSMGELDGPRGRVLPQLVSVAKLAIQLCQYDGTVRRGGGVRTREEALDNHRRGTGIVNSLHIIQSDGFGHAIDLLAITPGKGVVWTNKKAFRAMFLAIEEAAARLSVPIRQGSDWDMDGLHEEDGEWDLAHFEHPAPHNMKAAIAHMKAVRLRLGLGDAAPVGEASCPHCGGKFQLEKA